MCAEFINITSENIENEHLCCIIRSKKSHPGIEAKRGWLAERLDEGHVFRKLDERATVFIEYAPLESAWVPVLGENYIYIYCLWTTGEHRGQGYGAKLMEYCITDATEKGKAGICMLGADTQKAWLTDSSFAEKYGFSRVDSTDYGYSLLALSLDGSKPRFTENAKKGIIKERELTVYYDMQCPYIYQNIEKLKTNCAEEGIPARFILVDTLQKAKDLPCVFNNYAVFCGGSFATVNLLDITAVKRLISRMTK